MSQSPSSADSRSVSGALSVLELSQLCKVMEREVRRGPLGRCRCRSKALLLPAARAAARARQRSRPSSRGSCSPRSRRHQGSILIKAVREK
jgi:hypothetical protein